MEEDPGWEFTSRSILLLFVLQAAIPRAARRADPDMLVALRTVVTFCNALLMIGVVVVILGDMNDGSVATAVSVAVVVAVGCAALLAMRLAPRPLDCTSTETLAS